MNTGASSLAVLFPGQGSQEKGMGRDLAEARDQAMQMWVLAEKASGLPLREIYWDGDETAQADTRNLQPAMTAVTLNLWLEMKPRLAPMAAAGHSLGEYSALAAAGALSLEDALALTSLRGRLMAEAGGSDGAMAAVLKVSLEDVEELVARAAEATGGVLLVANYNTPGQYVLSGRKDAVEKAASLCKEYKGRAIPLAVSGAFHSPLIAEAAGDMAKALGKTHWRTPDFPVFMNATGRAERDPARILPLIQKQMTSSVRWIDTVSNLFTAGARTFLELGPKGVLTRMAKPNLDGREGWQALNVATLEAAQGFGG